MGIKLIFEIELRSDYHVGAGSGLGADIDSALLRDGDGIPTLRGTIITGLLRDGLWRLLQLQPLERYRQCQHSGQDGDVSSYCGRKDPKETLCPICRLFGTPRSPKRWRVSSARPLGLEVPTTGGWEPGETGAQVVQRVRVSPFTRRAEERKLFSQENGDGRLRFRFTIRCWEDGDAVLDEAALLVAAARNVRELGRSRRRGQGECRIHLIEPSELPGLKPAKGELLEQALLTRFEQHWLSDRAEARTVGPSSFPQVQVTPVTIPHALRFRLIIRVDDPIVVAKRGEAGNQFETSEIISGTTLRGAFAARAAECNDLNDAAIYADFAGLFLRGQVGFPFLYPAKQTGDNLYPAIPVPRDFLTCKVFPGLKKYQHSAQGFAAQPPDTNKTCSKCLQEDKETPLQPLSGFMTVEENPQELPVRTRSEMHIRVVPEQQRVKRGLLFGYTAIEVGQYFVGEMTFADEPAWQRFRRMTGLPEAGQVFSLRLGKAARRGYGQVTACLEPSDGRESVQVHLSLAERVADPTQLLTLTLLTDAVVTDKWGRYRLGLEADWLSETLGMPVDPDSLNPFVGTRLVDGFNAHLGLPRWRDVAIAAGSSVGFRLAGPPADWQERLAAIEREGIGLRRDEGFGRVVFNHPVYSGCKGITSSDIVLGANLRLQALTDTSEHLLSKEMQFRSEWSNILDDEKGWNKCQDWRFAAVARWLHAHCGEPLGELRQEMQRLGEPDENLCRLIPDYGCRSKDKKIGREGIELIVNLLSRLEEKTSVSSQRRLGVIMLAERIAATAQPRKEEQQ
jgi:CRISPR-associated protein Csx10